MAATESDPDPLTPGLLLRAYAAGLFPMADDASEEELHWVDPQQRGIFPLDAINVSRSLAKTIRSQKFEIRVDHSFDAVLEACAESQPGRETTWINGRIAELFGQLFELGFAHSVEAWRDGALVGGLYGLALRGAFCGESMFHRATDASKVCLVHLAARLNCGGFRLLDAQFLTPHLQSLGAVEISRAEYRARLDDALHRPADFAAFGRRDRDADEVLRWTRLAE
jgi:leucyl/phenylalanyl-tRNA--protein transferase